MCRIFWCDGGDGEDGFVSRFSVGWYGRGGLVVAVVGADTSGRYWGLVLCYSE